MRARGGAGHTNQTTNTPIPVQRSIQPTRSRAGLKPALPTKQPRPHHRSNTLIRHKHSPSPVGRERVRVRAQGGSGAAPPPPTDTHSCPTMQPARRRGRFQTCPANPTSTPPSPQQHTHPPQTFPLSRWTGEGWGEGPGRSGAARQPNTTMTPPHQTQQPTPNHSPSFKSQKSQFRQHTNQPPPSHHHILSILSIHANSSISIRLTFIPHL